MTRMIKNTRHEAQHPWPEDVFVQGGNVGLVFTGEGGYRTSFVEAFPGGTFLRGEGKDVAAAEDSCWKQYQRYVSCDGGGEHGPFEARQYTNGAGFCTKCGTWMSKVLPEIPEEERPPREPTMLDRLFGDPDSALVQVMELMAREDEMPERP